MSTPTRDLPPEEIAARLEISVKTLFIRIREGTAPPNRKVRGRRLFDATAFEAWLADRNGVRR